ncbi:hypothetical protein ILUMI_10453 [Ignelater luminosus]|uniref:Uncharacterized protein n=1 Tax=Ignelater luminosus TaxID=2038154 RepID=A0A8K0D235_IGNLU|nr:hypothetical protein ILUMI_10453 [Ignelater luminosus]
MVYLFMAHAGMLDFYQDEYDVHMHTVECSWYNKALLKYCNVSMPLYNRTQKVFQMFFDSVISIGAEVKIDIQAYKFTNNEYRFFPITVSVNACVEHLRDTFGYRTMLAKTSNIDFCNLTKGFHYVKNAIPDFSKYPPHLPRGMYKIVVMLKGDCVNYMQLDFYGSLKDKPDTWKKLL